jgi:hypothetical protein
MSRNVWNCGPALRSGDSSAAVVVGRFFTTFPRYTRFCVSVDMNFTTSQAASACSAPFGTPTMPSAICPMPYVSAASSGTGNGAVA